MAQKTIQLHHTYLLHLRVNEGFSQEEMSKILDIDIRQYQRIEEHGRTSPDTAEKIAKKYSLEISNLINPSGDSTLWLVTCIPYYKARVEKGVKQTFDEIKKYCSTYMTDSMAKTTLTLANENLTKVTISILYENRKIEWIIRPSILRESTGLIWRDMKEWDKFIILECVNEMIAGLNEQVIVLNNLTITLAE